MPRPPLPKYTFAMRIIDHQDGLMFLGNLVNFIQWSNIAIHAEHTICDHHARWEIGPVLA